jgi:hypothetical protein
LIDGHLGVLSAARDSSPRSSHSKAALLERQ